MKKIFALIMVLVLALAMSPAALAANTGDTINSTGGSQSGDVYVQVTDVSGIDDVYAVNITWGSLTFVYTATEWNTTDLSYDGSWTTQTQNITVKNNSNVAITTTNTLNVTETNGTTASITAGTTFDLEVGASNTITITASGKPTVENSTFEIGSVNVKIAKKS